MKENPFYRKVSKEEATWRSSNGRSKNQMNNISSLLQVRLKEYEKPTSWRNIYLDEILREVNSERAGTKYKPLTARTIAIKTSHLKTEQDFNFLCGICRDGKRRHGSYSKVFFGSLKSIDN